MPADKQSFDALFDPDRRDSSIWHARPLGLHAFGLLAPPFERDPTRTLEASDTTAGEDMKSLTRTQRPPALAHGTIQAILPDAIVLWLEGGGITRDDFRRVDWRWWPTHIAGAWEAKGVRISLRVTLIDGDDAVIETSFTNTGPAAFEGDLVIRGDDNYITLCRNAVNRIEGDWSFPSNNSVIVHKHPQPAQEMEYFPYSGVLPDDDPKFEYISTHYDLAFAFDEGAWRHESVAGTGGFKTWQVRQAIKLAPRETRVERIGFAACWSGRSAVPKDKPAELGKRAAAAQRTPFDSVVAESREMWRGLLAKAPVLKRERPPEWTALYYKAWVTVWADLLPPGDLEWFHSTRPIVTCLRIGDTVFSNPASWEGALGALVLSLADPKLGCDCLEAIYDTANDDDGYISETLGGRRGTALACVEPWIAWACYRRSGDKGFLRRIWTRLRKNLAYRLHFPVFKHGTVFNVRNYAYGNISARAAMKIAREIGCPADDVAKVQQMIDESERIVHAFWNEARGCHHASIDPNDRAGGRAKALADGTEAATLVALLGVARPDERKRMADFCRREYLTEGGTIQRYPRSAKAATGGHRHHLMQFSDFTVKESEHLAILKGLKDVDRDLFETVARGTIANLAIDGDFWECTGLDGRGKHNGPGSIFGAFAAIWALLLLEDQVDHLYD